MIDMENLLNLLDKRPKVTEKPGAKALKVTKGERGGRDGVLGGGIGGQRAKQRGAGSTGWH